MHRKVVLLDGIKLAINSLKSMNKLAGMIMYLIKILLIFPVLIAFPIIHYFVSFASIFHPINFLIY